MAIPFFLTWFYHQMTGGKDIGTIKEKAGKAEPPPHLPWSWQPSKTIAPVALFSRYTERTIHSPFEAQTTRAFQVQCSKQATLRHPGMTA